MESIWMQVGDAPHFKPLQENKTTDVLIVGGGIAGILCAYKLTQAGVQCLLVEADQICGGVTAYTTAKVTLGHSLIYHKLIKQWGTNKARLYLEAQQKAIQEYARLCEQIPCDWEEKDNYVYTVDDPKKIQQEIKALGALGVEVTYADAGILPVDVAGAVRIPKQAQFHPLKFLHAIARNLPIYEHTKVTEFLPGSVKTNFGTIQYNKLIIATHFPVLNKHGLFSLKLYQHRSYVIALKGAQNVQGMYVDESGTGLSFRNYKDLLLLGGGGHRTGKKGGCWQEPEDFARRHYPRAEVVGKWATQDCMTLDGVPYIGRYAKTIPDVYVATGFNKWGMTNSMVAANLLCDLVQGKANPYTQLFDPSRCMLHLQLGINAFESTVGLLKPTTPRCPHLGCALKYNQAEHSWDCPCHGSRFTKEGNLINNPATDDIKAIRK